MDAVRFCRVFGDGTNFAPLGTSYRLHGHNVAGCRCCGNFYAQIRNAVESKCYFITTPIHFKVVVIYLFIFLFHSAQPKRML